VLDKLSIDCIIDVGANRGQYGRQLRDIGYRGWIVSFEPVAAHFETLSRIAAENPPWRTFRYALGSENGQAEINVNEDDVLTSFLTPTGCSDSHPRNRTIRREVVEVRRLDSIFEECTKGIAARRRYLKLDTQGFDVEALRGADGVLDNFAAAQTEVSFIPIYQAMPNYSDSLTEFHARGFDVVDFMPVVRTADGLCMMEMDCILARQKEPSPGASAPARGLRA
jgi:FkbM family methyltransferase